MNTREKEGTDRIVHVCGHVGDFVRYVDDIPLHRENRLRRFLKQTCRECTDARVAEDIRKAKEAKAARKKSQLETRQLRDNAERIAQQEKITETARRLRDLPIGTEITEIRMSDGWLATLRIGDTVFRRKANGPLGAIHDLAKALIHAESKAISATET